MFIYIDIKIIIFSFSIDFIPSPVTVPPPLTMACWLLLCC